MINILDLNGIYIFQTNRTSWSNCAPRKNNIVSYQVEGHYEHTFSSEILQVREDCVFTISPNDSYSVKARKEGYSICIAFTSDNPIKTELIDCKDDPRFSVLFRKILQYQNLNHETSKYRALSVAYKILALITEKLNARYFQVSKNQPFYELRNYIIDNFNSDMLNIKAFRDTYGLSDKYIRERFRDLFGSTPTQYLIELRLNEAARLLSASEKSVTEISKAVGFSDIYYFSRLFKKRFQSSPQAFRTKRQ